MRNIEFLRKYLLSSVARSTVQSSSQLASVPRASVVIGADGTMQFVNGAGDGVAVFRGDDTGDPSVNYVELVAAGAGVAPKVRTAGADDSVGLDILTKGAGAITITGGAATADEPQAGFVSIAGGDGFDGFSGALVSIFGGYGGANGDGGDVTIQGGGAGITSGTGGSVSIIGGNAASDGAVGGAVTVRAGSGQATGNGALLTLSGGNGGDTGVGGQAILRGGAGGNTSGEGGSATVRGGDASGAGSPGGSVTIRGGTSTGVEAAGTVRIYGGFTGLGVQGSVLLRDASNATTILGVEPNAAGLHTLVALSGTGSGATTATVNAVIGKATFTDDAATTVTLNNSRIQATSIVLANISSATSNAISILRVIPGIGSASIVLSGAPGATDYTISFLVLNPAA